MKVWKKLNFYLVITKCHKWLFAADVLAVSFVIEVTSKNFVKKRYVSAKLQPFFRCYFL